MGIQSINFDLSTININLPDRKKLPVNEIVKDLFYFLWQVLDEAQSSLKDNVTFVKSNLFPLNHQAWCYQKCGTFTFNELKYYTIPVRFIGSLKKECSKNEIESYLKNIFFGYINTETNLQANLDYHKCKLFHKYKELKKEPKDLKGMYCNHRFNLYDRIATWELSCNSDIILFIDESSRFIVHDNNK